MKKLLLFIFILFSFYTAYPQIPAGGLVAWYPFCGNSVDQSGNGYDLTNAGATLDTDRFSNLNDCYYFNGGASVLTYTAIFPATGNFTYSCWIDAFIPQSSIIWYNGTSTLDGFGIFMNNGTLGTPGTNVEVVFGGGLGQYLSTPITLNQWHHLLLTRNGNAYQLYIDGAVVGFFVGLPTFGGPVGEFSIGGDFGGATNIFDGRIDDMAIYNKLLVAAQIDTLNTFNPDVHTFSLGNDTAICVNSLTLGASYPFSSPPYTYTWSTTQTTPTINVTPPNNWTPYSLSVTEPDGCTYTASINVRHINVVVNLGSSDTTICTGDTGRISVPAAFGETFLWSTGDTAHSILLQDSGKYFVVVDSALGCTGSDTINVHLYYPPVAILGADTQLCHGGSVTLKSDTTYSPAPTYSWGGVPALTGVTTGATYTATVSGTYFVQLTQNRVCKGYDTIRVDISFDTLTLHNPDTVICKGETVQIRAGANPTALNQWTPSAGVSNPLGITPLITPDTSAWYTITSTIGNCHVKDSLRVDVIPPPSVFVGNGRSVCRGDTLHITPVVSPAWYSHYIYDWTPATFLDHSHGSPGDSDVSTVIFTAGDSTTLYLTIWTPLDSNFHKRCVIHDSLHIFVRPNNFVHFDSLYTVCPGDSVRLTPPPAEVPSTTATYVWHPGMYLSDSTLSNPWVHAITTQNYWGIATSQYGCRDTVTANVTVRPSAVIYLGDSVVLYPGETYQISPQTNCVNFTWRPAAGISDTTIANPVAYPSVNTKFYVNATTEWGCEVKDSINIRVTPSSLVDIPNAFTPGATSNGLLYILRRGYVSLNYFRIFNRWGNIVYESNNINSGWDGTFNGKPQPFDVYVYDVEAVTNTGIIFHKTGNVTLLR